MELPSSTQTSQELVCIAYEDLHSSPCIGHSRCYGEPHLQLSVVVRQKMSTKRTANDVGEVVKIRLVNLATIDGWVVQTVRHGDGGPIDAARFSMDEAQWALVLCFTYFNMTLAYD